MAIRWLVWFLATVMAGLSGCATPRGSSVPEKQVFVRTMRDQTLADLYAWRPDLQDRVENAEGYAVFSNINVHVLIVAVGHGYGIVRDNRSGQETFMRMAGLGTGFGAELKDFRAVFVFPDRNALDRFVRYGWEFGAGAEVGAMADDKGAEAGSKASVSTSGGSAGAGAAAGEGRAAAAAGFEIYQLTQAGVALSATLAGTKYWRDGPLNAATREGAAPPAEAPPAEAPPAEAPPPEGEPAQPPPEDPGRTQRRTRVNHRRASAARACAPTATHKHAGSVLQRTA